jgi:predicted SprT family Zn-dependent metalloprotease
MPKMICQSKDSKAEKTDQDYRCKKCGAKSRDERRLCKPVKNKK